VPKTLVTGATGFIGSHVARALAERGDELKLFVRRDTHREHLADLDFEVVTGDITDRRSVKRSMKGVGRVFHCAGTTSLRPADTDRVFAVNLDGATNVMTAALEADVERVVHMSSAAALGPARPGKVADENQRFTAGSLGIPYVNSKHEAEVEGLYLAARGLDVVFVSPTFVLGPDAPSRGTTSMGLVRRFLMRQIPVYSEGALNIVDVRDVAKGHLLADEKGGTAERYILAGRNFTIQRLFADLARLSGVEPPPLKVNRAIAVRSAELITGLGLPLAVSVDEVKSGTLWWTYRNTKAKRELGFRPRPHEETLEDAVTWQMNALGDRVPASRPGYELPLRAVGGAVRVGRRLVGR
jgi:dihydroflavonol-4-reductase